MPEDATAFSHRGTQFEYGAGTAGPTRRRTTERMAAARRERAPLDPFADGVYVNSLSDEGAAGSAAPTRPRSSPG